MFISEKLQIVIQRTIYAKKGNKFLRNVFLVDIFQIVLNLISELPFFIIVFFCHFNPSEISISAFLRSFLKCRTHSEGSTTALDEQSTHGDLVF